MDKQSLNNNQPYYAVIFTSKRSDKDEPGYLQMASIMTNLAKQQAGFLGVDSARDEYGLGITVSYWQNLESIRLWKDNMAHIEAQNGGKQKWYEHYSVRICRVEKEYGFESPG